MFGSSSPVGARAEQHDILEARRHKRAEIKQLLERDFAGFQKRFWDGRVFGNTFLEEGGPDTIRTGVAHVALAVSVAPIRIERLTMTKMAPAQDGKDGEEGPTRGMAPLGYRVVEHGVYCMPFFINPTAAGKTGCTTHDIALLLSLIPHAYPHTKSSIRPLVEVRHAWYGEHKGALGSFSEFRFIETMTPKRRNNPDSPSVDTLPLEEQYEVPRQLPDDLKDKVENFYDLCNGLPPWCKENGNGTPRP